MKEYILDTNYILRFFLKDIAEQTKIVKKYFIDARQGKISIHIPYIIFLELEYALKKIYGFPKHEIVSSLMSLAKSSYLKIERQQLIISALNLYLKYNFSLVDLILFSHALYENKELLTFDKRLRKLNIPQIKNPPVQRKC